MEPVRPVADGVDPLNAGTSPRRTGPVDLSLLRLAPPLRRHLQVCAVLAVLITLVVVGQAEVVGRMLPQVIGGRGDAATRLAGALLVIGLARLALRWSTEWFSAVAVDRTREALTLRVLRHSLALDETGAAEVPPARAVTALTDGIDALTPWIRTYLPALCVAAVLPLTAGLAILIADPTSALILAVTVPAIPVVMALIGTYTQDRTRRQWAVLQRLAGHFHDVLVGLPTLRLFGRAEAQVAQVRVTTEQYRRAVMQTLRVAFLSGAAMELLSMLSVALVAVTMGYRLTTGSVSLRTALVVLLLAPECSAPIRRVGAAFHAAQAGSDAGQELEDILATSTTPDGSITELPAGSPETPVLTIAEATVVDRHRGTRLGPVSAAVSGGSVVAVVGPSGGGKSTLLDAARCRVPLRHGTIELDGVAVDQLARSARRDAIAWIPQVPRSLAVDVRSAVAADGPEAVGQDPTAEVLAALDLTGLASRPLSSLSGGELQRVAVARAVARCRSDDGVRLLLADEPTAQLDSTRRDLVVSALRGIAATGRAVVVATHDPAVIAAADLVVGIDDRSGPVAQTIERSPRTERVSTTGPVRADHRAGVGARGAARHAGDPAWYRRAVRPFRARLLLGRLLAVAAEGCTLVLAGTAAWLIVRASERPSFADLALAAVVVRACALGKALFRYCERLVSHDATFRSLAVVRGVVVEHLGRVAPAGVAGMERGDVIARVVDDVDRLADRELRVMSPATSAVAVGLGASLVAGLVAPAFGLAYLAVLVLVAFGLVRTTRSFSAASAIRRAHARGDLAGATLQVLEGADELTANAAATPWTDRIAGSVAVLGREERRRGVIIGGTEGVVALLAPALAGVLLLIARALGPGTVSGPVLAAVVLVPFALLEALAPLVHVGEVRAAVDTSVQRVGALLDAPDPVEDPIAPVPLPEGPSPVALEDARLRWPESARPAVSGLDLRVGTGERLRVEGPSGSGKSTIAAALVRFIGLDGGSYRIGDTDVGLVAGDRVRELVVWCQQSPWVASTSLRENLLLAAPDATDEVLWAALRDVQLAPWVARLPDQLSTAIGRDGAAISGGQRQRLALARVLLAGHDVVVLDEPTAHLDAATADRVMCDLLGALDRRTVIVLGHDGAVDALRALADVPVLTLARQRC